MEPLNKLTADGACRTVFSNDVSFASFYNAAIFEGKQIIHPDRLVRYENDISFIINDSKRAEDKKRRRNIVVKSDINGIYYFEIPEELKKYFNDWKIILVDVKEMDTNKIKDEQTRYFIEAIQAMYKGSYEDLKRLKRMKKENFLYAAIITGSIDQVENVLEGDEMDMCEGMERMAEGFRKEGRSEGVIEGKLEEKQNTLKEQLEI